MTQIFIINGLTSANLQEEVNVFLCENANSMKNVRVSIVPETIGNRRIPYGTTPIEEYMAIITYEI